tara:strand:+ start:44 stop:370 length:327 start_codon:yes stop_codon:yes gene_type:complete
MKNLFIFLLLIVLSSCVFETEDPPPILVDHHHDYYDNDEYYYNYGYSEIYCPWAPIDFGDPYFHSPVYCDSNCCEWEIFDPGVYCEEFWCYTPGWEECGWFLVESDCY